MNPAWKKPASCRIILWIRTTSASDRVIITRLDCTLAHIWWCILQRKAGLNTMIAVKSDLPTQLVGSCGIRYDELFRDAGDAMLLVDSVVLECNQAALKLFRATRDQIASRPLEDLHPQQQSDGRNSSP